MVCKHVGNNVKHIGITIGQHARKQVFISRTPLSLAKNEGYPFQFKRKQFPICFYFVMTINKPQSQTIRIVEVYLPQHVKNIKLFIIIFYFNFTSLLF